MSAREPSGTSEAGETHGPGGPRGMVPLLAGIATIGPFAIDTYLPAFGSIGRDLGATPVQVQQTLTAYLVTFAAMVLLHGALSDALGRRRVVLWTLALFAGASLVCAAAQSIEQLWIGRALQGLVGGAGLVLGRAIARDLFDAAGAQRLLAHVTMVFALAPAVAPVIGGWLYVAAGWRSVFVFLAAWAVVLWLLCARRLPETLPKSARQPMSLGNLWQGYSSVFRDRAFWLLAGAVALNFVGFFIYVLSAPVFLMTHLGVSPQAFAWLFVPAIVGTISGAWTSGRMAGRLSPARTIRFGLLAMMLAAAANVAISLAGLGRLPWAIVPLPLYLFGMSFAAPALTLVVLDRFSARRGMASSCQSFLQSATNAVAAGVVAPLVWGSTLNLALTQLAAVLLAALLLTGGRRAARRPASI